MKKRLAAIHLCSKLEDVRLWTERFSSAVRRVSIWKVGKDSLRMTGLSGLEEALPVAVDKRETLSLLQRPRAVTGSVNKASVITSGCC
jgi:hypothetical protein